jgi:4-alpha-glucanotransferase
MTANYEKVKKINHHGIALPLFSLRNPQSSGIGEFLDLIPMIEWCSKIGFDVIQLLPLNDSGSDSSPYSAQSAEALHPIYLSLTALPYVKEVIPDWEEEFQRLSVCNSSQRFNYDTVLHNKLDFLWRYFEAVFPKFQNAPEFQAFVLNEPWLEDYVLFKVLKKFHHEHAWWDWGTFAKNKNKEFLRSFKEEFEHEMNFHMLVQFLAFSQWAKVRQAAVQFKVFLKGDIPILINRDSADVWANQEIFQLEYAAGAPPDMYSEEGQYWGFPIYNWAKSEETGYAFWKMRLKVAEKLYDIFRLDHIVGFFKIWAIPYGKPSKEGFFIPQDQNLWIPQGKKILEMMLASTSMLPIGEDLGAVPPEVRQTLRELGIPGTKVIRWERKWNEDRSYIPIDEYIPESMTTVSTHDSSVLAEWWLEDGEEVSAYCMYKGWEYKAPLTYKKHLAILEDAHCSGSLFHINLLQEYLNLFPKLTWTNPKDERINIPGVVLERNWTYRYKPTVDEIVTNEKLAEVMRHLSSL